MNDLQQAPDTPAPDDTTTNAEGVDPRIKRANAEAARYRVERNAARERITALEAEMTQLREQLSGEHAQEVDELSQQLTTTQQALDSERTTRLRIAAAAVHGLPLELAERLQGEDAESLHADAQRLSALFPLRKQARTGNGSTPAPSRATQIFNRIGGGDQNAFDLLLQQRAGGGSINDADA